MQTSRGLVGGSVKLSSRMKSSKKHPLCRYTLFMHAHRDAPSVILHGGRAVSLKSHLDGGAEACQMLVHRVVHYLIQAVVKSLHSRRAYIHTGS